MVGIQQYPSCEQDYCMNGGSCIPFNNAVGKKCMCNPGYGGSRCEMLGQQCYEG